MKKFEAAYIPIGVPTYHLETAEDQFEKSKALISEFTDACRFPEKMLLSVDDLSAFLDTVDPDLVILQNLTFANAAFCSEVMHRTNCPVILWTLREPVIDGTRLRLNSLTGAYSAANTIKAFRENEFEYVFGAPEEAEVRGAIRAMIRAAEIRVKMSSLKMTSIGHTPQGFGFGRALDSEMLRNFGVTLESIEARELIEKAKGFTEEEIAPFLKDAESVMKGLSDTPEKNRMDFARLYKAYKEYVTENHVGAVSSRCWPDFFTSFGTPVCAVLAMLNDMHVPASCEADAYGALSMFIGSELTGQPTFFGDPVSMDEKENTITYWHCGTAACSLAREDTGAEVGVHCNRKIGPTLEFGCKPCSEVTVFRIGRKPDGAFRFFIASGEAIDKPKQFYGTSVVVKTENNAKEIVTDSIKNGWEPHFVVVYGNVSEELTMLAHMFGMEVCQY